MLLMVTGWFARRERELIFYLIEENRCLRRQLRTRRVRPTDDDRRRLAARAYLSLPLTRSRRCPMTGSTDDGKSPPPKNRLAAICVECLPDVALFLPFRCTKERQTAASAGTERRPMMARFFE